MQCVSIYVDEGLLGATTGSKVSYWDCKTSPQPATSVSQIYVLEQARGTKVAFLRRTPLTWRTLEADFLGTPDPPVPFDEIPSLSLEHFKIASN